MHGHRRSASVAVLGSIALTLAAGLGQVDAQSPGASAEPSQLPAASVPAGSAAPAPSAAAIDVATLRWKKAKPAKVFHPSNGPIASDLAVGANGRTLLAGLLMPPGAQQQAAVWGSDDGVKWSALKGSLPKGSAANAVIALDDGFLIAGSDDQGRALLRRSDGKRLSKLEPSDTLPQGAIYDLARSRAGVHAAGLEGATPTVWTSADGGTTWSKATLDGGSRVVDIAATDDGTIAALGVVPTSDGLEQAAIWTSTDGGATWTSTTLPVQGQHVSLPDLERTPVGLVATVIAHSDAGGQASAWSSPDGITWQQVLELPTSASVGTAGGEAIILGSDSWWHSPDGVTWTEVDAPQFGGFAITTSAVRPDGSVVAAGSLFSPTGGEVSTWIGAPAAP
jgi:hypothetical protein